MTGNKEQNKMDFSKILEARKEAMAGIETAQRRRIREQIQMELEMIEQELKILKELKELIGQN